MNLSHSLRFTSLSNISLYEPLYRTNNSTRQVKDHLIIWFSLCALLFVLSSACLSESSSLPSCHKHWSSIILLLPPCLKWPALLLGWKGSRLILKKRRRGLKKEMENSGRSKVLRALFGIFLLLGVFWFFSAAILVNHTTEPTVTVSSTRVFKHWKLTGREKKHALVWDSSTFIYVSKRRVPNGPDPIHNRRAVNTRQPAGRT